MVAGEKGDQRTLVGFSQLNGEILEHDFVLLAVIHQGASWQAVRTHWLPSLLAPFYLSKNTSRWASFSLGVPGPLTALESTRPRTVGCLRASLSRQLRALALLNLPGEPQAQPIQLLWGDWKSPGPGGGSPGLCGCGLVTSPLWQSVSSSARLFCELALRQDPTLPAPTPTHGETDVHGPQLLSVLLFTFALIFPLLHPSLSS